MKIHIQIGSFNADYILCKTNAPKAYDGMGTFEVYSPEGHAPSSKPSRMVLVREEHFEWQAGRNASGLHTLEAHSESDSSVRKWVMEKLLDRLTGLAQ